MARKYLLSMLTVIIVGCVTLCFDQSVAVAEDLPEITLVAPDDDKYRNYLGIEAAAGEDFSITDIKTDILLIELFSMYCPYCQAEAPRVNELFTLAEELKEKGTTVKIIGLGASNTQFEVDYFKESFEIQFPLFPDKTLTMYKQLQGEGTPGFIATLFSKDKPPKIILRQSGGFDDASEFLAELLDKAGLQ